MKKMRQLLALLLAGTMVVGCATGCGKSGSNGSTDSTKNDTPLVIASGDMSEKFSEFFGESAYDTDVAHMTSVALLGNTRAGEIVYNGIKGETYEYNGTEYTYKGISDCVVTENEDGTVDYEFTLRDDITFSDGEKLTADDVIFSYYVLSDPTYDGSSSLYSLPIKGMEEYRKNMGTFFNILVKAGRDNTDFTYWDEATQTAFWADLDQASVKFTQEIVDYMTENAGATSVAEAAAGWGFRKLAEDATVEDFFAAMVEKYQSNYAKLSKTESAGSSLFDLMENYDAYTHTVTTGESAANISGIQKTGEYSVKVTLTEVDATAIYNLAIYVCPLHYYGSDELYDYENNKFGFEKGDLSSVKAKTTKPLGAGPYKFVKFENKIAYLEANENYYEGAPKIKYIQVKTTAEADNLSGVVQGTVDISEPSISTQVMENIKKENSNGEANGDKLSITLTDYNGYGYIGINANNVSVGGDGSSDASKNLRRAIATVLAVYRDVAVDSYYGEAASVINYPISNTSWAAPQKSDADYRVAFSVDVDGNPIYTEGMSDDEKYAAALDAAAGFLKAAGYTFGENGKITAAPSGAKTTYELMIGGGGKGDHPSMGIVTSASKSLEKIGFTLKITDLADTNILWDALDAETAEIWCAAWQATLDPDMFQIYHSEGGSAHYYAIKTDELDEMVMDGRTTTDQMVRKAIYKDALEYVVDYAVEIPIYQRQECSLYSSERVNMDSVTKDQTSFYTWRDEIETLEMK